jgi:glyoxylase-like metal-dependent hydrolase (beta-lactamase superfamily II)
MSDHTLLPLPADTRLIDLLHLGRPHVIGSYLLQGDQPALIDPGPASTLETLEAGLAAQGVALADLQTILLTHIHLDHAGATGTLLRRYPHMRVYVHPRGAPHLVAPEKLIHSATRLYGDVMQRLWGPILPVPEQAISLLSNGETLHIGTRTLHVYNAPGHASHHVIYFDTHSGAAWIGDTGGVCRPGAAVPRPATPPPDIDIEAWQRSLDMLRMLDPSVLLLTHFGPAYQPLDYIEDYRATLLHWAEIVQKGLSSGADEATQIAQLDQLAQSSLGASASAEDATLYEQASATALSWQGLARYWRKRAERGIA